MPPISLQRLFSRWAGVSPKRFLQVLTVERAKRLLADARPLLEVSDGIGLSSGSRLYDHLVHLEAVTPGESVFAEAGGSEAVDADAVEVFARLAGLPRFARAVAARGVRGGDVKAFFVQFAAPDMQELSAGSDVRER